jgi:hypothetical protein
LGRDLRRFESRNSRHQHRCIDNASRLFSFSCWQRA